MSRLLIILLAFLICSNAISSGTELRPAKVEIFLNDGSVKSGFVIENLYVAQKDFLKDCLKGNPGYTSFQFFKRFYTVHDDGLLGGFVSKKEEVEVIDPKNVKEIKFLPNPYVERKDCDEPTSLTNDEIKVMQGDLISTDSYTGEDGMCTDLVFNYNPKISKTELNKLLSEFKNQTSVRAMDEFKKKMLSEKLVFSESCCD